MGEVSQFLLEVTLGLLGLGEGTPEGSLLRLVAK